MTLFRLLSRVHLYFHAADAEFNEWLSELPDGSIFEFEGKKPPFVQEVIFSTAYSK